MTRSTRTSWSASFPVLPARASASSWLTRSIAVKERTRAPLRTRLAPIATAIWLLPVPIPPEVAPVWWTVQGLAVAAKPVIALSPTTQRIAGARVRQSIGTRVGQTDRVIQTRGKGSNPASEVIV